MYDVFSENTHVYMYIKL